MSRNVGSAIEHCRTVYKTDAAEGTDCYDLPHRLRQSTELILRRTLQINLSAEESTRFTISSPTQSSSSIQPASNCPKTTMEMGWEAS